MRSGLCRGRQISVDPVRADIHDADAHAVAGLDDALLVAVADAGVDVETAMAEAPAGTPVVEAVGRRSGGREGGSAERTGGDQTKSKLTKHFHSPAWREAVVVSLHLGRAEMRMSSHCDWRIVFRRLRRDAPAVR